MPADISEAYRRLQADFNEAIEQLEMVMTNVTGSTNAIYSGTQELSAASDNMGRRTEQPAKAPADLVPGDGAATAARTRRLAA